MTATSGCLAEPVSTKTSLISRNMWNVSGILKRFNREVFLLLPQYSEDQMFNPFPNDKILDSSKQEEFADNNFIFNENGRKLSKLVENTVGKGEIITSNFSFSRSVLERLILQTRENQGLFGKGLLHGLPYSFFKKLIRALSNTIVNSLPHSFFKKLIRALSNTIVNSLPHNYKVLQA